MRIGAVCCAGAGTEGHGIVEPDKPRGTKGPGRVGDVGRTVGDARLQNRNTLEETWKSGRRGGQ